MDVPVVMINYNTYNLTKNALESLFQFTIDINYEVILVDNKSPDGSGGKLQEEYKGRIKYIQAGDNLGTSKAFNLGLKDSLGKYILWLNTDVIFKENFIKKLYDFMEENPLCGICGGNLIGKNGEPSNSFGKRILSLKELKRNHNPFVRILRKVFPKWLSIEYNYTGKPMRVGCIIGADMMVRRTVFDSIGGFCEDIFMYGEECEFTYRMSRDTNFTVMSVPNAKLIHLDGASFNTTHGGVSERRIREQIRGTSIFFNLCYGEKKAVKYLKYVTREAWFYGLMCRVLNMKRLKSVFNIKYLSAKKILTEKQYARNICECNNLRNS